MNVWVIAYYDMDWKDPGVAGVYATKETADKMYKLLQKEHAYRYCAIMEPVERQIIY